jgi:imidazolonepropionase-like amidohydrolase
VLRTPPRPKSHRPLATVLWLLALAGLLLVPVPSRAGDTEHDLAAARALFEKNLRAIADKDRDAYLSCYLESENLARTGPAGSELGYEELVATAGEGWPAVFEGRDLRLTPVEPGLVYGTYRYRVVYADEEAPTGRREVTGLSERLFVETPKGWKIAVTTAFEAPPGTPPPPRALVGGTLVDGTGADPVPDAVVLLRDGRIECAGTRADCAIPEGVDTLDVSGHWVTPGLIDAHVHFSQTGWADGRPDSLDVRDRYPYAEVIARQKANPERWFRADLCSGVTSVFDVGGYPWTLDLPERTEDDTRAPRVTAAGPLLSTWDFWLNLPAERQFVYLEDESAAREGVRYLAARGSHAIKVWFIPVEERDFADMEAAVLAVGDEAKKQGLPLIVHATGLREAKVALRAGAYLLVHSVWDQPVDDEFLELARENGTIYNPTLTVPDGYLRMAESASTKTPPAIDDPNGCVDADTRRKVAETVDFEGPSAEQLERRRTATERRAEIGAANLEKVHEAGIPIAMGTDAGNPLTLHGPAVYAEMEAMEAAGLTPMEVLVSATRGGARAMGRESELGTVEAGKLADLVVLAADPTASTRAFRELEYVIRGGVVRPVEELRADGP